MNPAVDVDQVEVLEVEMITDVENISDADETEVPTGETTDTDLLPDFGGEE